MGIRLVDDSTCRQSIFLKTKNMEEFKNNFEFIVYLLGLAFIVYNTFRKPQIRIDKDFAVFDTQFEAMNKLMNERFLNIDKTICSLRDNHIHTIEKRQDIFEQKLNECNININKLSVIIDERIPKK